MSTETTSKIIAKYKGADGSLGYQTGQLYVLEVLPKLSWINMRSQLHGSSPMAVRRTQSLWQRLTGQDDGMCPYDTEQAFLANWEPLEVIAYEQPLGGGGILKWLPFL
jgi:hypothetical protein